MNYSYFPRNDDIPESIKRVFNIFKNHENEKSEIENENRKMKMKVEKSRNYENKYV